jgi:hypothetical protein
MIVLLVISLVIGFASIVLVATTTLVIVRDCISKFDRPFVHYGR